MTILSDVRYGVRLLAARPAFAVTAGATIALAIAGNTIVFALIWGILLAPLPLPEPDRLVRIEERHATGVSNVQPLVFGVPPRDPVSMAAAAGLVMVAGLAAVWGPAMRARRVDPAASFRSP